MRAHLHPLRFAMVALLALACDSTSTRTVTERIAFETDDLAFGSVPVGGQSVRTIQLRNEGSAAVQVQAPRSTSDFLLHPRSVRLGPGRSIEVEVHFTPRQEGGASDRLLMRSVASDAEAILLVEGVGMKQAIDIPPRLEFGDVALGEKKELTLPVKNLTDVPLDLSIDIQGWPQYSIYDFELTLAPQEEVTLPVLFSPESRGEVHGALQFTPCVGCRAAKTSLLGHGLSSVLSAAPNPLDFGQVPRELAVTQTVTLTNEGDGPIALGAPIRSPRSGSSFSVVSLDAAHPLPAGASGELHIQYLPGADGIETAMFRIPDEDGNVLLDLQVTGAGGGSRLVVTPSPLDFGLQPVGRDVRRAVRLEVFGDPVSVQVDQAVIEGPDARFFSVWTPELPLLVSDTPIELQVGSLHSEPGLAKAELVIRTQFPAQPEIRLPLSVESIVGTPCDLRANREELMFGVTNLVDERTSSVKFRNHGSQSCHIWDLALLGEDALPFSLIAPPPVPFSLEPEGDFEVEVLLDPVKLDLPQLGVRDLFSALSVSHGDMARPLEIPIRALVAWDATNMPHAIGFEPTPIDRARVETVVYISIENVRPRMEFFHDADEAWHVVDMNQWSYWDDRWGLRHATEYRFMFRPTREGHFLGQAFLYRGKTGLPYVIDLEGVGTAPCGTCKGWPEPFCGLAPEQLTTDTATFRDDWPYECQWSLTGPPALTGHYRAESKWIDGVGYDHCEGTFRALSPGTFSATQWRIQPDGKAAVCDQVIQVKRPTGLWVEVDSPIDRMEAHTLFGAGSDPLDRSMWWSPSKSCRSFDPTSTSDPLCESGHPHYPAFHSFGGRATPMMMHVPDPAPESPYHLGIRPIVSMVETEFPVDVRVYCDGTLVHGEQFDMTNAHDTLWLLGTARATASGCSFSPDGSPAPWPYEFMQQPPAP